MKFPKIILITVILILLLPVVVLAQDIDLPQTAVEALGLLSVLFATVGGLVAGAVTDWLKSKPWLTDQQKEDIGGSAAKFIAAVVSTVTGLGVAFLMPYVIELDTGGGYAVILAVLTMVVNKGLFELEGYRRALAG